MLYYIIDVALRNSLCKIPALFIARNEGGLSAMATTELAHMPIYQLIDGYRKKKISPVEATTAALTQIARHNPALNAYSLIADAKAQEAAKASEARWQSGRPKGLLDGVPISVKDTLMVSGYPFRRGSLATDAQPVKESAPIVDRAFESGAVMIGITTTPEFGSGPVTISPLTGITRNPWDHSKGSGGSSGGAAAAVAAGMGQAALATDAGGSIRIPSSLCGVVGLKTTGGRIPTYPPNVAGTLSTPGPIARNVADVALLLDSVVAADDRDPEALPVTPGNSFFANLRGLDTRSLRIAFTTTLNYAPKVDEEVAAAVRQAAAHFEGLGAHVVEAAPRIDNPLSFFMTLFQAGFSYSLRNMTEAQMSVIGDMLRDVVGNGRKISFFEYMTAQDERRAFARKMQAFFNDYDILLTPTVAVTAFDAERYVPEDYENLGELRAWTPFGYPFNMSQQPAITLPCGFSRSGLPIGLQIVGPRFSEQLILQAAHAFESTRPGLKPWPCL